MLLKSEVAHWLATEEAKPGPEPMVMIQRSLNGVKSKFVSRAIEQNVATAQELTAGAYSRWFHEGDVLKAMAMVCEVSRGMGSSPSGGLLERSARFKVPHPIRIKVKHSTGFGSGGTGGTGGPDAPFVPCRSSIMLVTSTGPGHEEVQVICVFRPDWPRASPFPYMTQQSVSQDHQQAQDQTGALSLPPLNSPSLGRAAVSPNDPGFEAQAGEEAYQEMFEAFASGPSMDVADISGLLEVSDESRS